MSEPETEEGGPVESYAWRDETVIKILHLLDQAHIDQGNTPRAIRDRRLKVQKCTPPQSDQLRPPNYGTVPAKVPQNWVVPAALARLNRIQQQALELGPPVNLNELCHELESMLTVQPAP